MSQQCSEGGNIGISGELKAMHCAPRVIQECHGRPPSDGFYQPAAMQPNSIFIIVIRSDNCYIIFSLSIEKYWNILENTRPLLCRGREALFLSVRILRITFSSAIKVAQRDLWISSAIFVDILSIFTHIYRRCLIRLYRLYIYIFCH